MYKAQFLQPRIRTGADTILHLKLHTGSAFDYSLNGNTGTLAGDPHFVPGSGLEFDGVGGNIDQGNSIFTSGGQITTDDLTISFWVKTTGSGNQYVIGQQQNADNKIYINVQIDYLLFVAEAGGTNILLFGNTNVGVDSGQWTHLAFVAPRGQTPAVYKNGVSQALTHSTCDIGDISNTDNLYIAKLASIYFNGTIGEVAIFKKELSALEVLNIYNQTKWRYGR